jgi:hypothetical protein
MKTISLNKFIDNYMEISKNLTHAETRLLYLLIKDPDVIKISRKILADIIGTNRRTIWLGIEKLQKFHYISDIKITNDGINNSDNNITTTKSEESDKNITIHDIEAIKKPKISNYDKLLNKYLNNNKYDSLIQLFEDFPDKLPMTLYSIKDSLPENIDILAAKYGFEDILKLLKSLIRN